FAFGHWHLPSVGIEGFAIGIAAGNWLTVILMLLDLQTRLFKNKALFSNLSWPRFSIFNRLFSNGYSSGLRLSCFALIFIIAAAVIGHYQPNNLAYFQMVSQCFLLSHLFANALSQPALIRISQIQQQNNRSHMLLVIQGAYLLSLSIILPLSLVLLIYPEWIISWFRLHPSDP
ncbi:MAG: hypothetical protein KDH94_09105, partial [Coxiellaceae bacterium]|nr:hypothetical protein [Coxiellaceae bacterium]